MQGRTPLLVHTLTAAALLLAAGARAYERPFPASFRFCAGVSAHQQEGGNVHSDWWRWEQDGAAKSFPPSGSAVDHWSHVDEDVDLAASIGVDTLRIGIEWARIEPVEGRFDPEAVAHYRHELERLRARGIAPLVVLWHITLPTWVADKGGLAWDGFPLAFARYARFVSEVVGPDTVDFATSNDAVVHVFAGYVVGVVPPHQKGDLWSMIAPMKGFLRAHAAAYHAIHAARARRHAAVRVGVIHHMRVFDPAQAENPLDRFTASIYDQITNWTASDAIARGRLTLLVPPLVWVNDPIPGLAGTQDFVGINYFTRGRVKFPLFDLAPRDATARQIDLDHGNWETYPAGLTRVLVEAHRRWPGVPLWITENGAALRDDMRQDEYLRVHLAAVLDAIDAGVPVEGYCWWSLLDTWEWTIGFEPRYGLFAVDRRTMTRARRPIADEYARIARRRALDVEVDVR